MCFSSFVGSIANVVSIVVAPGRRDRVFAVGGECHERLRLDRLAVRVRREPPFVWIELTPLAPAASRAE
jgi:hypothetical protein